MKNLTTNLLLILSLLVFGGCANLAVDPNRAGCIKLDGKARTGSLTQYIKGTGQGVSIYVGKKLRGKVKITCTPDMQEIIYK